MTRPGAFVLLLASTGFRRWGDVVISIGLAGLAPAVRAFRVSVRIRHEYTRGAKAGDSPGVHVDGVAAAWEPRRVDVDTLAIGVKVASGCHRALPQLVERCMSINV